MATESKSTDVIAQPEILEDDDEFEEFETESKCVQIMLIDDEFAVNRRVH